MAIPAACLLVSAAAAGCALASVQSTLSALRRAGIVETGYLRPVVRDLAALRRWPGT